MKLDLVGESEAKTMKTILLEAKEKEAAKLTNDVAELRDALDAKAKFYSEMEMDNQEKSKKLDLLERLDAKREDASKKL